MEIQTIRLITVSDALTSLLYNAKNDINDNFGGGSLYCPFISSYESYMVDYVPWKDDIDVVSLELSSFETELRDNFLQMDETKRLNYVRFLKNRLEQIFVEAKEIKIQLDALKDKVKKGEINEREIIDDSGHKNRTISNFISYVNNVLITIQDVESIYIRNVGVFHFSALKPLKSAGTPTPQSNEQPTQPGVNQTITWNLSASVLYDVFAQLLKITLPNGSTPISREGHTIKHLAAMIHQNIQFAKGNSPTIDQIERELQRMSAPDGIGAKRDKITIICKSESATE
ncbi:hypothetical protein [Spirosoma spitsbergense]|uniref:hypothetical protein n=1 Tax=Spirosoma spitsbergense TaxID=431554 RepID=UPI000368F7D8|nr:hypothetical protein [Spirosoma spitsbergense]